MSAGLCTGLDSPAALEKLEPRLLLTDVSWDGGGDGSSWHDPLNWDGDTLPGETDAVRIEAGGEDTVYYTAAADPTSIDTLYSSKALVVAGGRLRIAGDAQVDNTFLLDGGTLSAGYLMPGAGGEGLLYSAHADNRIHGLATAADIRPGGAGGSLSVVENLTLAGATLEVRDGAAVTAVGDETGMVHMDGAGEIVLADGRLVVADGATLELSDTDAGTGDDAIVTLNVEGLLTNEAGGTIETNSSSPGWGDPAPRAINAAIENFGTVTIDEHTATTLEGGTFANRDTGTLHVKQPYITHGVAVTSIVDGTLTGGTYRIANEWVFDGAEILANAATLILDDGYIEDEYWDDALAHLALNTAEGTLDITSYTLSVGGSFTNAGFVRLYDEDMHLAGSYTQTGGVTKLLDWAGIEPGDGGVVRILGGELTGEGVIRGHLINSALLRPRDSGSGYGFAVSGDYVQTLQGTLDVALRGYSYPRGWDFDHLEVYGQMTLGGTLKVTADSLFAYAFKVVAASGPAEGGFCVVDSPELSGWVYRPRGQADGIVLDYVDVTTVAPRAWSELEFSGCGEALSSILLGLSEPVAGPGARDAATYTLLDLGADRQLGGGDDVEVSVTPSYVDGEEAIELTPAATLGEGAYRLTVRSGASAIGDADGNALDGNRDGTGGDDYVLDFIVDTTPPPAVADLAFAEDWGVSDADGLTGDDELEFSWTPPADEGGIARYEYRYDGGAWHWTLAPAAVIRPSDGVHTVAVRPVDVAGNTGPEASVQVTIETTGPAIVTHSPQGTVESLDHIDVTFSEPLDAATFTPSDVAQDVLAYVETYTTAAENTGQAQGYDIEVAGSLVYASMEVGWKTYFQILDLSTPGQTQVIWSLVSNGPILDVEVAGSLLFLGYGGSYQCLTTYDVSTPSSPRFLSNYPSAGGITVNGVEVVGSLAYIAGGTSGLAIVDVSTPEAPAAVGSFPCSAMDVVVSGSLAYVADAADNTLKIVDVSTPASPTLVAALALSRTPLGMDMLDARVYLAMESDGLWIVDVSTPSAPELLGQYQTDRYVYDVEVVGRYAYLAGYRWLEIVDVLVPSAPGRVDSLEVPDYFDVHDVAVDGSDVYLAGGKTYRSGGSWWGIGAVVHADVGAMLDIRDVAHAGGNTYRLAIGESPQEGTYSLAIGPDVRDLAGNLMDQNRNGRNGETWDGRDTYFFDLTVSEIGLGPVRDLAYTVQEGNFAFTWTEPAEAAGLAGYEYQWDGGAWTSVGGQTSIQVPASEGAHTFAVRGVDGADNAGGASSIEVTVDLTGPSVLSHAPDGIVEAIDHLHVTFSEQIDPATFTVEDLWAPVAEWVSAHSLAAAAGDVATANGLACVIDDRGGGDIRFTVLDMSAASGPGDVSDTYHVGRPRRGGASTTGLRRGGCPGRVPNRTVTWGHAGMPPAWRGRRRRGRDLNLQAKDNTKTMTRITRTNSFGWGRAQGGRSTSVLDLNFLPVTLESDSIDVWLMSYPADGDYGKLRKQLGPEWSVWREGDSVFLWSDSETGPPPGVTARKLVISPRGKPALVSGMVGEAFQRELVRLGFCELGHKRKCFVNFAKGNFLAGAGHVDGRVGVYPKIMIEPFFTSFKKDEYVLGLVVDVGTLVKLDVPVSDLVKAGMDCRGFYVIFRDAKGVRPELAEFDGFLAGKISDISAGKATLTDTRDPGLHTLDTSLLYLEPKRENLWRYLDAVHPGQAVEVKRRLDNELHKFHRPKRKWELIEGLRSKFCDGEMPRFIQAGGGLKVRLAHLYQSRQDSEAFRFTRLRGAVFTHDFASGKTSGWADGGLREHGPYDRETFPKKDVRILVVSPAEHKGQVEQFIRQFEKGFSGHHAETYNGFVSKYHLRSVSFEDRYFAPSGNGLTTDYERACLAAMSEGNGYDLCFIVIREDFEALSTVDNPYYVSKALMLSQGIPVQEVKIETLRKPLDTLPYVLNNIGLACYAKLGGTPYVLRAEEVVRKELVIGIGRAIDRDTRLAEGKPVIGFTTVFKSNGDFLLSNCTPYCAFEDYQQQLEDVIVSSVERVAEQEGYEEGEEVRIIFHVFKRTGKRENNAVLRGLERLRRYRIEYSLLHVNDTHLFLMFDRTNGQGKEADYVAPRGVAIELGPRERLVNLFGPKQYLGRGFPSPLRLTLDNCSTFRDINYLSQQLFEFSFMSWRGFNPAIGPATLLYSEWIAQLNSKLRKVPNWNQHMLTTLLADKRWFL